MDRDSQTKLMVEHVYLRNILRVRKSGYTLVNSDCYTLHVDYISTHFLKMNDTQPVFTLTNHYHQKKKRDKDYEKLTTQLNEFKLLNIPHDPLPDKCLQYLQSLGYQLYPPCHHITAHFKE